MKKLLTLFFLLIGLLVLSPELRASSTLASNAKSAILIEANTGKVLFEKEPHFRLPPASMTKVMSLILVYDALENGTIKKTDIVTVSAHAKSMGGSQVYLEENEKISVDELLKCVAIVSANDAMVALAELIGGSEGVFVDLMNHKAKEMNLKNTNFVDCTGLTFKNHFTSAFDMAKMGKHLINTYPDVLNYTSLYEDYIRKGTGKDFWLVTTNKLINKVSGIDGLKTGWTRESGYCLTATMTKNNMRLISVLMGEKESTVRNQETVHLLNYGFAGFEVSKLASKGDYIADIKSLKYFPRNYQVVISEDFYVVKSRNEEIKDLHYKAYIKKENPNDSYLEIYLSDNLEGKVKLNTTEEVKTANVIQIFLNILYSIIEA